MAAIDAKALETDTVYLASDAVEGRGPGTRGGAAAEAYIAGRFAALGLAPAGAAGTFFQEVPMRESRLSTPDGSNLTIHLANGAIKFAQGVNVAIRPSALAPSVTIDAPLVFVGFGIARPDLGYDDLAQVDVRGAVVLAYTGAPKTVAGKPIAAIQQAVLADLTERRRSLRAHGARALVLVWKNPDMSFDTLRKTAREPVASLIGDDDVRAEVPMALVAESALEQIFASTPARPSPAEVWSRITHGEPMSVPLQATASLRVTSELRDLKARNVIGLVPGRDPNLARETVVYSAHHDHLGVGEPVNGDRIYNGALDNALGVATLVQVAHAFRALTTPPRRTVLFLATTGEEMGLLGAEYFVQHPTVVASGLVADINLDAGNAMARPEELCALGAELSTLWQHAEIAARVTGYPLKELSASDFFLRADQYPFALRGIPSVFPLALLPKAYAPVFDDWLEHDYHQPSDEWRASYDTRWTAIDARYVFMFGLSVAMDDQRPRWNAGSPFAH